MERFDELIAAQDTAIGSLTNGSWRELDPGVLETGLSSLMFYPAIAPPRSVYDELLGSGVFGEISNPEVRASIAVYYSELEFVQGQLEYFRDDVQRSNQLISRNDGVRVVYDPDSEQRMSMEFDFATLADDSFYLGVVVGSLRNQIVFQSYRRSLLERAGAMLTQIETLVGGRRF